MQLRITHPPLVKRIWEALKEYERQGIPVTEEQYVEMVLGQMLLPPEQQPHRNLLEGGEGGKAKKFGRRFPWYPKED